jgi:hypothetical protein
MCQSTTVAVHVANAKLMITDAFHTLVNVIRFAVTCQRHRPFGDERQPTDGAAATAFV